PDAAFASGGAEAARVGDPGRHHQEVLHVGVVSQQRVAEARGDQRVLDLGLVAASRDGRVRRRFAGDLHDVPGPGSDSAVDDVQLLARDRWTDEYHARDVLHRRVDRRRMLQITLYYFDSCSGQR